MRNRFAILLLTCALTLAVPLQASGCVHTTSEPEVTVDARAAGGSRYYIDNTYCHMCPFEIWVYEESNGIDGLQRRDSWKDDTCDGQIEADAIVF